MTALIEQELPRFQDALLAGDRRVCVEITTRLLDSREPVLDIYTHLFQTALYRVGELWEQNRISVATEHMATAVVEGLLNQVFPRVLSPHRLGRRIVVASVEGELHQVGAKMVCDLFEMHGWDGIYLGADTPTSELIRMLDDEAPDMLGLSFSIYFHLPMLRTMVEAVRARFPQLPILIGGQGLLHGGAEIAREFARIDYVDSLYALDKYIRENCLQ